MTSAAAVATARQTLATAQSEFATAKESLQYLISPEVLYWEEKVAERQEVLAEAQTAYQTDTFDSTRQKVTDAETSLTYAQNQLKYFQAVYEETYIPKNFTQYRTRNTPRGSITEVIKVEDEATGRMIDLITPPTEGEIGMARARYDLAKAAIGEAQTYLDVLNGEDIPEGATGASLLTYIEAKHALETAQYNLDATKLTAPFNGTVISIDMNVGDTINGDSVMTISNLDQPYSLDAYLDAGTRHQHVQDQAGEMTAVIETLHAQCLQLGGEGFPAHQGIHLALAIGLQLPVAGHPHLHDLARRQASRFQGLGQHQRAAGVLLDPDALALEIFQPHDAGAAHDDVRSGRIVKNQDGAQVEAAFAGQQVFIEGERGGFKIGPVASAVRLAEL